ncbi:His Kinase A (phospho-acceptor) domain-containing protein [Granulicella rosea]|uniref:histidine kinase n=1 Tax=Granulicella rosea TaxID=474952 RepID=A0A239KVP6_9BACT|nr:sensor histidine kinase [Granulicella rosea]SNT21314.1 His Kinase A (phospho-acceptor) domain-containing protein [Granulicella rosea]
MTSEHKEPLVKRLVDRRLIPALLAVAIVIVIGNAWMAFRSVQVLLENEQWVEHTWQVIYQVELIMGATTDAETGARGYLITNDKNYLSPYYAALEELPKDLDGFGALTSDNPAQVKGLADMRNALADRLLLLKQGIAVHNSGDQAVMKEFVNTTNGHARMERLRHIADGMENEEKRLLAQRVSAMHTASVRARITVAVASALDFLLILLMFRYFVQERRMRFASEDLVERLAIARRQAEASAQEVRALNATLEERVRQRTAELETTNRELEAFSYSVSHDLRAPLRTIDGFSLALEEDYSEAVDAVGRDYISRTRAGVQRMGQLIDALLRLSRITRATLEREDVDLTRMAEEVVADLRQENPGRELHFTIEPGMHAQADPKLLRVALENLLGNAVKFTGRVAVAEIEFGWDEAQEAWFVRDNGAGFDMYYAEKLFNAFNRLHGDKDFKGSGIGLATVARVIRRHLGRIWADSVVDHGATFWFTLG